jgi:glycosyltransferase involved in cell wall biosynthesis
MKRALMIAYHFPPFAISSGIQRTLRFVQHLPEFGWEPLVLTVQPRAYERTSEDLVGEVPSDLRIERTFALDTARHLSIAGRYPEVLARPDRWTTWRFSAVRTGMRLVREWQPDVIWSTYPIATAHVIGNALQRRSGLPWIADFRDPMAQDGYPVEPETWRSFKKIESGAVRSARFSTFTTPGAARVYRERYPDAAERITVLENGFDEESFAELQTCAVSSSLNPGAVTLLHSGIVYPSERDPTQFFAAIRRLAKAGAVSPESVRIRFRAAVHDGFLQRLAERFGVQPYIELLPPLPYREALLEMMRADGLLVFQASNCNEQIPAKIYEYLRCGRPILGLTDHRGDTAGVLQGAGLDTIASLDSAEEIFNVLGVFITAVRTRRAPLPKRDAVVKASRRHRTENLARLLDWSLRTRSSTTAATHTAGKLPSGLT